MAEVAGSSTSQIICDQNENKEDFDFEPEKKKQKKEDAHQGDKKGHKLEQRLCGILCCAVCLDMPKTCFQCTNGHLMCAGCFNHLLADGRLKDETATCPNCRCEINKNTCSRNLAVEKAVSELPMDCQFCLQQLPRNMLIHHEKELCQERPTICMYDRIGCPWRGPFHEHTEHQENCIHPKKSGAEVMDMLFAMDQKKHEEAAQYDHIFSLLSYEKITFSDLQLKPYRTDDFLTKLYYETSRFSAFNLQWVIKARVNHDNKEPAHSCRRSLSYQLVLKSRISHPVNLHYLALRGPYGDMKVNPSIYNFEFSNDATETQYQTLPTVDLWECNKLLAGKSINLRLIMFQVQS